MKSQTYKTSYWRLVLLASLALVFSLAWAEESPNKSASAEEEKKKPPEKLYEEPVTVTKHKFFIRGKEEYIIGPEDVLAISVWREAEISRTVPVRPDGMISLPLIGELKASGLTPLELNSVITDELKNYLSNPEVTVIVQKANSQKFNIVGQVQRPGSYHLGRPMTVLDALAVAGGFRDFANGKKIYVLRRLPNGRRLRIPFNYKEVIKGRKFYQNVELEPGDTIVVP